MNGRNVRQVQQLVNLLSKIKYKCFYGKENLQRG